MTYAHALRHARLRRTEPMRQENEMVAPDRKSLPDLWEVDEVAASLRVSRATLERYIREGRIATVKLDRRVLIEGEAVTDFILRHRRAAAGKDNETDADAEG